MLLSVCALAAVCAVAADTPRVEETVDVARVWSGHPVGFALLTVGKRQLVAYYDADRRMTIADRTLGSRDWRLTRLPETVGWDSHNYIALAADRQGILHISGNMHASKLVYFRSKRPWDPSSLERATPMVGPNELHCTYPQFISGPGRSLLFTYRDGRSGDGDQIWNQWDPRRGAWRRLLDRPLTSGEGKRNAYFVGPVHGPDSWYHLCWVWRDTPDCATNHDLSYARSRDMVHWETGAGKPLALPMTLETAEIVDPVPKGGGIINGNTALGFDSRKRPVISYHKYDARGMTQAYTARLENGRWVIRQTSNWSYRWSFGGGGSIVFEVGLGPVSPWRPGRLRASWRNVRYGSGVWELSEETLQPVGNLPPVEELPASLRSTEGGFPGMGVRLASDAGSSGAKGVRYVLRWETLAPNRDRPRPGELPPPSMLRVIRVRTTVSR